MSLGVFWSLLNPLVTMFALTFVFTKIFTTNEKNFPVFVLCGLVPFNFFAMAWSTGTGSLLDNSSIIKKVPVPREVVPIATVLGNCVHLLIQIGLLLGFTLAFGIGVNRQWLWLPVVWGLDIIFVCGLALISAAVNVYVRDTRYIVESANAVIFWLVPIFYSFTIIPDPYKDIYALNPVAALVMAQRNILLSAQAPPTSLLIKLALISFLMFGFGLWGFRRLKAGFYDYL
jgi:ABC-type polysaccharide/polyol phosphate export permease